MSSAPVTGPGTTPWTARRVEVYALVPGSDAGPLLVPGGSGPRVPGVVLAHGEGPRDAARRALGGTGTAGLRLRTVLSDVRDVAPPPGLHVLRLVFEAVDADGAAPELDVDPELLRDPDAARVVARAPGGPPQVQRPAAYAVVVLEGHALLSRVTGHGVWTLPGGGIDHGEHPDDAVRRETFEETGLELTSAQLLDADSRHFTGRSPAHVTEDFHGVRILYRGTVDGRRTPVVQEIGGSTDAAAWVSLQRLPEMRLTDIARTALSVGR
jgi:8-oxo-dGTP diphosphatase